MLDTDRYKNVMARYALSRAGGSEPVAECQDCGALVSNREKHDEFHGHRSPQPAPAPGNPYPSNGAFADEAQ